MSLLSIAQECASLIGIPIPNSVIGNNDGNVTLLKNMLDKTVQDLILVFPWPELEREWVFQLVNGQAAYQLPADFDRFQSETFWNRTQRWPLIGPLDAIQWQAFQSGLITSLPRQRFRIKQLDYRPGLFLNPTPSSSEAGQTCVFEFVS